MADAVGVAAGKNELFYIAAPDVQAEGGLRELELTLVDLRQLSARKKAVLAARQPAQAPAELRGHGRLKSGGRLVRMPSANHECLHALVPNHCWWNSRGFANVGLIGQLCFATIQFVAALIGHKTERRATPCARPKPSADRYQFPIGESVPPVRGWPIDQLLIATVLLPE